MIYGVISHSWKDSHCPLTATAPGGGGDSSGRLNEWQSWSVMACSRMISACMCNCTHCTADHLDIVGMGFLTVQHISQHSLKGHVAVHVCSQSHPEPQGTQSSSRTPVWPTLGWLVSKEIEWIRTKFDATACMTKLTADWEMPLIELGGW